VMMKGEGKAEIVSVHNNPIEIFPCRPMHMMMHFIATIVVAAFTVVVVVAATSAGVMYITYVCSILTIRNGRAQALSIGDARGYPDSRIIIVISYGLAVTTDISI